MYPAAGHIMTGNLKIISDSRIRYIVSKGPKYRFPSRIDFKKCREEIASALNDFGNRWCKREYVEPDALKEWEVSIFKILDQRIKFAKTDFLRCIGYLSFTKHRIKHDLLQTQVLVLQLNFLNY